MQKRNKMNQFYIGITILFVSYAAGAFAQQASLTGRVVDEQAQPLDLATVHLLDAQDSTIARTIFPDKQGGFAFAGIAPGSYRVSAVLVGYDDGISEPIVVTSASSRITVGTLVLKSGNKIGRAHV